MALAVWCAKVCCLCSRAPFTLTWVYGIRPCTACSSRNLPEATRVAARGSTCDSPGRNRHRTATDRHCRTYRKSCSTCTRCTATGTSAPR
uniref:Putative secreted protein n=1 Tax=Anopheles triannulatus TaxID=58253 RepID=A0A2M4B6U2_9DIPT